MLSVLTIIADEIIGLWIRDAVGDLQSSAAGEQEKANEAD